MFKNESSIFFSLKKKWKEKNVSARKTDFQEFIGLLGRVFA